MYKLQFTDSADKIFQKIDFTARKRISDYLDREALLKNPKSFGSAMLYDYKGSWRYRVGDYRIICRIEENRLLVLVIDIGHRSSVYK